MNRKKQLLQNIELTDELIEMYGKMILAVYILEETKEFASLIPEVRTNIVYSKKKPESINDVLGVEGRITVINNYPYACGKIKFGVSSHLARQVILFNKVNPHIRSAINFKYTDKIMKIVENFTRKRNLLLIGISEEEPVEISQREGASMKWRTEQILKKSGGKVPDIIYSTGRKGKEDMFVILGKDPIDVVTKALPIALKGDGAKLY